MKIFEANITSKVIDMLSICLKKTTQFEPANQFLFNISGIINFFENQEDFAELRKRILDLTYAVEEQGREEYGDFQTSNDLASKITVLIKSTFANPKIVIEPTCGKGNFIIESLKHFSALEKVYGVEIYKPYFWETKFNILQYFIANPYANKPEIKIQHFNIYNYDFAQITKQNLSNEILVIGNPPWVTNSKLGELNSNNIPIKSNFKKHNGYDAITGKGNFDIGEYITLMMFNTFQNFNGYFAFLIKNSVIKNIVYEQKRNRYKISDLQKYSIDSKKEFNVSVEASLFTCKLNTYPEYSCKEFNFYDGSLYTNKFGWVDDKYVSNIVDYKKTNTIDGICQFEWRQGVKHDCSAIMELDKVNSHFVNGLGKIINLEEDLVYGLLKSSDLKNRIIDKARKFTIITQKKIGQETSYIKTKYPQTYSYLYANREQFELRKSSIYKGKPSFSIFGIGDYSFKQFKVSISGLYKSFNFNLVLPQNGKTIMLDDTCYFIGFDKLEFAVYTLIILNSEKTKKFLQSITFIDAKRTFTKDILMRIDLLILSSHLTLEYIQKEIDILNQSYPLEVSTLLWEEYINSILHTHPIQNNIFSQIEQ